MTDRPGNRETGLTRPERPRAEATSPDAAAARPARVSEIRAFDWQHLGRVSRASWALARDLSCVRLAPDALESLRADLARDLAVDVQIGVEAIAPLDTWRPSASPGCYAIALFDVDAPPLILDIDLAFALRVAAKLAGAGDTSPPLLRAPTAIERGLITYLLLRALAHFKGDLTPRLLALESDIVALESSEASAAPALAEACVAIDLDLRFGDDHSRARAVLPAALVRRLALSPRGVRSDVARRLAGVWVSCAVEVAQASLSRAELTGLSPRDVVLCRPAHPHARGGPRLDRALLRPRGARRAFAVTLEHESADPPARPTLRVEGICAPPEATDMDADDTPGESLLADAALPLTVELGRITLRAEEIAALRPGDTLLVGRPTGAGVDLVAGGKVVARGELVDVEGELGVRITALR